MQTIETREHIDGSLSVKGDLHFEPEGRSGVVQIFGDVRASGCIMVKSGWYIESYGFIDSGLYIAGPVANAGWSINAGGYIRAGSFIVTDGSIKAEGSIESGGYIDSGRIIVAGETIRARGFIESGESIDAGGFIESGSFVNAGGTIRAGSFIKAEEHVFSFMFEVYCELLSTRRLPFWRGYYAEMPPLRRWREQILDQENCWEKLRNLALPDAEEICAWDGWHWLIRAQLRMFFGLSESERPPANQAFATGANE